MKLSVVDFVQFADVKPIKEMGKMLVINGCRSQLDTTLDGKYSIYNVCFLQDSKHNLED
jgi:hypothetical protein